MSTLDEFDSIIDRLAPTTHRVTVDYETDGKDWRKHKICGIVLNCKPLDSLSCYIPVRHRVGPNLPPAKVFSRLFTEVLHPDREQTYFHGSFDMKVAAHHDGYRLPNPGKYFDPILGHLALNENEYSFKLEDLCKRYINSAADVQEDKLIAYLQDKFGGAKSNAKGNLWKAPPAVVAGYGEQDGESTDGLANFCKKYLKKWKLEEVYRELCDFQVHVARIELRGLMLDIPRLGPLRLESARKAEEALDRIHTLAGYPLNPRSAPQVTKWLDIPNSTKELLTRMSDERADLIVDYRKYSKAESTFYKPYITLMDSEGILRCNLHLTTPGILTKGKRDSRNGTISGRLSSSKPNLHQIPRESDKYKVKHIFRARPGYVLVELDYSQAELRIAAHYSQDVRLTSLLLAGEDIHSMVASELGVPRHIAKNINFSAWYGIGWRGLSTRYFIEPQKAKRYLRNYHKLFPGIRRLSNYMEARARKQGFIRLYTGRIRRYNVPQARPHTASNNLIQGTVAQVLQRSMMRCGIEVPWACQVLTVHDSVWFEVPEAFADCYAELGIDPANGPDCTVRKLKGIMQDQPLFGLPLLVDEKRGTGFACMENMPRDPIGIPPDVLALCTDPSLVRVA